MPGTVLAAVTRDDDQAVTARAHVEWEDRAGRFRCCDQRQPILLQTINVETGIDADDHFVAIGMPSRSDQIARDFLRCCRSL